MTWQGKSHGILKTPLSSDGAFHWLNPVGNFRARKSIGAVFMGQLPGYKVGWRKIKTDFRGAHRRYSVQTPSAILPGLFFKQFPHSWSPCALAKILHMPHVTSFGKSSGISFSVSENEARYFETMRARKKSE